MRKYKKNILNPEYKYYMDLGAGNDKRSPQCIMRTPKNGGAAEVLSGDRKWRVSGNMSYKIISGDSYIDEVTTQDVVNFLTRKWKLSEIQAGNLLVRETEL